MKKHTIFFIWRDNVTSGWFKQRKWLKLETVPFEINRFYVKKCRIYIYIIEEQYSLGGCRVAVQFRNHSVASTDRSLKQGYYREKLLAAAREFPDHFFFLPSSLFFFVFPWKLIEPYNTVYSTRIDSMFARHRSANISPGAPIFLRRCSRWVSGGMCHPWNSNEPASRVVMPSEACDISCHASRHARENPPRGVLRPSPPYSSANSWNVS